MRKIKLALVLLSLFALTANAQEYTSRYFHYNQYFDAPVPFTITATTIDTADANAISIAGGGDVAGSRGAFITLTGNEKTTDRGKAIISSGSGTAAATIDFYTWTAANTTALKWAIDASAVGTSNFIFGDHATANPVGSILGYTLDGADTGLLHIAPAAFPVSSRGAFIDLYGNEFAAAAYAGDTVISTGSVAGSAIRFEPASYAGWYMPTTGSNILQDLEYGDGSYSSSTATIRSNRTDADDVSVLFLAGGGATASTRGAYIGLYGNEHASDGKLLLSAGNEAGDGGIYFNTGGVQHFSIPLSTTPLAVITYGILADVSPGFLVRSQKLDGSDDAYIQLTAGGSYSGDRGAGIQLLGNDYGGAATGGTVTISGGGGTTGYIDFWTQVSSNVTSSKWTMPIGAATVSDLVFGTSALASSIGTIRGARADNSDDTTLYLTGGGAVDVSRGGYIQIQGNDVGGWKQGADLNIWAGRGDAPDLRLGISSVDGTDNGTITIMASSTNNTIRSAWINLLGNDTGGAGLGAGITAETGTGTLNAFTVLQNGYNKLQLAAMSDADDVEVILGAASTTLPVFTIRGRTADGDDDSILQITAGGASTMSGTRGAYVQLEGEDVGGANSGGNINIVGGVGASNTDYPIVTIRNDSADGSDWGRIAISAGGAATGNRGSLITLYGEQSAVNAGSININGADAAGQIRLVTHAAYRVTIADTSSSDYPEMYFGDATYDAGVATIRFNTTDGDDDGTLRILGGNLAAAGGTPSGTRGAYIILQGQDVNNTNRGGDITIASGAGLAAYPPLATIRTDTVNGSDWGSVEIYASDTIGTARGASIILLGDDFGGAGVGAGMTLEAGTGTAGTIKFNTVGTNKWTLEADGDLVNNATTGGNLIFNRDLYGLVDKINTVAAAGSDLAGAAVITSVVVTVTGADETKGVKFPTPLISGQRYVIYNTDGTSHVHVYAGSATDNINNIADNGSVELHKATGLYCHATSTTQLWCIEGAEL
jgi:hypothetical protein